MAAQKIILKHLSIGFKILWQFTNFQDMPENMKKILKRKMCT